MGLANIQRLGRGLRKLLLREDDPVSGQFAEEEKRLSLLLHLVV